MRILLYFTALCLTFSFASCDGEEFLEETELSFNQPPIDFQTNEEVDDILRGAYFNLKSPGDYGALDLLLYQDIATDVVDLKPYSRNVSGPQNMQPLYVRDADNTDFRYVRFTWGGPYTVLYNANSVLDYYTENGPLDDELANAVPRIMGEAYFLRAFAHYLLVTTYAPPYSSDPNAATIPLRTSATSSPTDLLGLSNNEETYQQIVSDLKEAIDRLPPEYDANIHPEDYQDRAKRGAAQHLLAKVYFLMGEEFWDSGFDGDGGALEQINALINSGLYPLEMPDDGDLRSAIFSPRGLGQNSSETVWYVPYYFRNAWRAPRFQRHYSDFGANNNGRLRGFSYSKQVLDKIDWEIGDSTEANNDLRYGNYTRLYLAGEDPSFPDVYEDNYNMWSNKFLNRTENFIVFRSPELYLMRASIRAARGDGAGAAEDINVTRTRAGLEPLDQATAEDVEIEMLKEMAFEGRRLFFLQALKQDIPAGDRPNTGPIPYDDPSLVRGIPDIETTRNPNLEGN